MSWRPRASIGLPLALWAAALATATRPALALSCTFGARDKDRGFSILVDGEAPGLVRIETFPIPPGVRRQQDALTVTFQAANRWGAAITNVFACAVRRAEAFPPKSMASQ